MATLTAHTFDSKYEAVHDGFHVLVRCDECLWSQRRHFKIRAKIRQRIDAHRELVEIHDRAIQSDEPLYITNHFAEWITGDE